MPVLDLMLLWVSSGVSGFIVTLSLGGLVFWLREVASLLVELELERSG
jgi:hypothetical protein